jgi:hypothetical protein
MERTFSGHIGQAMRGSSETDQTRLIGASLATDFTIPAMSRFILLKVATLLSFFLSLFLDGLPTFTSVLVLAAASAEFWVCKNWDGLCLVGMRWSHEVNARGDPTWEFYSRRDPYVPGPANSVIFWSGMFGACLVWGLITLLAFPMRGPFVAVYGGCVFAAEVVNMFCFRRCNSVSYTQAGSIARLVLLFPDVHDSQEGEEQQQVEEAGDRIDKEGERD